jgi:hypothetical protein
MHLGRVVKNLLPDGIDGHTGLFRQRADQLFGAGICLFFQDILGGQLVADVFFQCARLDKLDVT